MSTHRAAAVVDWLAIAMRRGTAWEAGWLTRWADRILPPVTVDELYVEGVRFRMQLDRREIVQREIHYLRTWEPGTARLVRRLLRPGDVFYDVGANVGFFTLLAATVIGPDGMVVSFEPSDLARGWLEENIRLNGCGSTTLVVDSALSDAQAELCLSVPGYGDTGSSSLAGYADASRVQRARCARLDDLMAQRGLPPPRLVKMDIEGWEHHALRGASRLLREVGPELIVEVNPARLAAAGTSPGGLLAELHAAGFTALLIGERGQLSGFDAAGIRDYVNILATKQPGSVPA